MSFEFAYSHTIFQILIWNEQTVESCKCQPTGVNLVPLSVSYSCVCLLPSPSHRMKKILLAELVAISGRVVETQQLFLFEQSVAVCPRIRWHLVRSIVLFQLTRKSIIAWLPFVACNLLATYLLDLLWMFLLEWPMDNIQTPLIFGTSTIAQRLKTRSKPIF